MYERLSGHARPAPVFLDFARKTSSPFDTIYMQQDSFHAPYLSAAAREVRHLSAIISDVHTESSVTRVGILVLRLYYVC